MKKTLLTATLSMAVLSLSAQSTLSKSDSTGYQFTVKKEVAATPVKNQASSGTCWSFSGLAFIESELLRNGKGEHDLSEMWIVRHTYLDKARKYARMHGSLNLAGGGATHDVFNVIDQYGIVPEEAYTGLNYGSDKHIHGELDATIKAYMDAIIRNPNRTLSTAWETGLNGILDAYLGKMPEKFNYRGKEYTPESFAKEMDIKGSDYVSLTSFNHHPFYSSFAIEVPDNWAWGLSYNLPLDELAAIFDQAINNGYSVLWAADVSERGFLYNKGFAIIPEVKVDDMSDSEKAKWSALTPKERDQAIYKFDKPGSEATVTQQSRQAEFDNYKTTDDHGMQITGIATDQNGTKYYKVKNSWGTDQLYKGYFYASEPFIKGKTMNIMVSKSMLSKELKSKLGL